LDYIDPTEARPMDQGKSLEELVKDMSRGQVEMLLILGGNPAFTAPADLPFVEAMRKVPARAHLSLYQDETSRQCQWHLPEAHYLEAWSDTRAFDGTATIVQPLIAPLYEGRSAQEVVSMVIHGRHTPGYDLVRATWREHRSTSGDFDDFWDTSVHDG